MDIAEWEFVLVPTTGVRQARAAPVAAAIDANTGDQAGVSEGVFAFCWKGETL